MPNHNNTLFEYTTKTIILCSGPLKVVSTHKQLTLIIVVFLLLCFSPGLFVLSLLFSRFIRLLHSLSLQGPILILIVFQYIYVFVIFIIFFYVLPTFWNIIIITIIFITTIVIYATGQTATTRYMNNTLCKKYHYSQTDKKEMIRYEFFESHNIIAMFSDIYWLVYVDSFKPIILDRHIDVNFDRKFILFLNLYIINV